MPTPQLPVLPPSLCLVTLEGVRWEGAWGFWLSTSPSVPPPLCFLSHIPYPGVSLSWDLHLFGIGAREPERLALPVLSLFALFFPLLPSFSFSLPGSCLQPNPAQPRPTSCSLAP